MAALGGAGAGGEVPSSVNTEDLTGTCWRDDMWLGAFGLHHGNVLDYFALSPFYDRNCNNERGLLAGKPRAQPPALGEGVEYLLADSQPPHLFILRKMYRHAAGSITTLAFYYILDGSVYQAPSLQAALLARMLRCMFCIKGAFKDMQRDLAPLAQHDGGEQAGGGQQQQQQSALERELAAGRDVARPLTAADRDQQQRVEANVRHVLRQFPLPVPTAMMDGGAGAAAAEGGGAASQLKAEPGAAGAAAAATAQGAAQGAAVAAGAPPLPSAVASHGGT